MTPKNLTPVGRDEPCPCGSGRTYLECCLGSATRYFVDEGGRIVKIPIDFATCKRRSDSNKKSSHIGTVPASDDPHSEDCDHDCEHCDQRPQVGILIAIDDDETVSRHVSVGFLYHLDTDDVRHILERLAVIQACLLQAFVDPTNDESRHDDPLPVILVGQDEDESIGIGMAPDYKNVPRASISTALEALEGLRITLMSLLFSRCLWQGFDTIIDPPQSEGPEGPEGPDDSDLPEIPVGGDED